MQSSIMTVFFIKACEISDIWFRHCLRDANKVAHNSLGMLMLENVFLFGIVVGQGLSYKM
jgi:hypothetical protein